MIAVLADEDALLHELRDLFEAGERGGRGLDALLRALARAGALEPAGELRPSGRHHAEARGGADVREHRDVAASEARAVEPLAIAELTLEPRMDAAPLLARALREGLGE